MRQRCTATFLIALAGLPLSAHADGFLWLGSEYQAEGTIFRYNLQTGTIDRTVSPPRPTGVTHWNNMATDGQNLYLGSPSSQYVAVCDPDSGAVVSSYNYSPSLSGHKEDGAYRASSGTLWRVTYSSALHEVTTSGQLVRTFSGGGPLVGLEWIGETLYATNYSGGGNIGTLSLNTTTNTVQFTVIPWAPGNPAISETAALAYDADSGVLYMCANRHRLWSVTFSGGMAHATLVADLSTLGYPANGLIDGMGWFGLSPTCYANCDNSTQPPILNIADFSCFLSRFAAADPYANCDNSTQPPILNIADFSCFLSKFAAGCP